MRNPNLNTAAAHLYGRRLAMARRSRRLAWNDLQTQTGNWRTNRARYSVACNAVSYYEAALVRTAKGL